MSWQFIHTFGVVAHKLRCGKGFGTWRLTDHPVTPPFQGGESVIQVGQQAPQLRAFRLIWTVLPLQGGSKNLRTL